MKEQKTVINGFVNRRDFLKAVGISAGALAIGPQSLISPCFAGDIYPAKKITCLVPNPPGGGYDFISRGVAPFLAKYFKVVSPGAKGGDVIIKNEPSAGGRKLLVMLNNAKPDGYTFGALDSSFATESLTSELEFDLNKFTYLLQFNDTTRIVVVRKDGFANWNEMMKAARVKELKWGLAQFGRATHVDSIIIREAFGIPARLIPFGGTSGMMAALIRGDVQMATGSDDSAKSLIAAGEIRVLADFTAKGGYPGVPTSVDLGRPDLVEKVAGHRFFIGPPNMPKGISNIMIAAFKKSLQDPAFLAWAKKIDLQVNPIYGEESEKMAKRIFKYYTVELRPLLTKYLVQ